MQFREIKQHHLSAIISIVVLFIVDILAFYLAYLISDNTGSEFVGIKYPVRVLILIIFLLYVFKRYNPAATISIGHESKLIIQALYLVGIVYIFYKILSKSISIDKAQYDLVFLHSFIFLDVLFRFIARRTQRVFLRKGIGGRKTVIVGQSEDAYNLADEINRNPSLGFTLQGYFNETKSINMDRYCAFLGTPNGINTYLANHNIHEMIIALDVHKHDKLLQIIGEFNLFEISINIIPDMYEAISGQVHIDRIRGLPLLNINPDIMTEFHVIYKRAIDLCICVIALIILSPVNLLIALIIRITTPGKIFYKQIRIGLNGVNFTLFKFRTMYDDSEHSTGPIWSDKSDSRITGFGKILRKHHLDEIPQLFNVLYGNMSIIGPRPERPEIIKILMKEIPYYSRRCKVKPGLSGWAQVMGVYDVSVADVHNKLKHDFYYIENMSIMLDIKIILLTIFAVLRGKGR